MILRKEYARHKDCIYSQYLAGILEFINIKKRQTSWRFVY